MSARHFSVLMICPQFAPLVGGYERAAERLAESLGVVGHQVVVLTERRDWRWPKVEKREWFTIHRAWCVYRAGLHTLTSLMSFAKFMVRQNRHYQIIHVHQFGDHAALAVFFGRLFRKPVVLKLTSTGGGGIAEVLAARRYIGSSIAWLHRHVDACVATTLEARDEAIRFGIAPERVHVVPNGIDTSEFAPLPVEERTRLRRELGVGSGPVVLYCGRLSAEKNPIGLINAWRGVHSDVPEALLLMVGDGPDSRLVQDAVECSGAGRSIRLLGRQNDVAAWYQSADLFVLPSHFEGLSNSLLEAMSCGLPVVSAKVSGSTEILTAVDAGDLVDVGDMAGLRKSITLLLRDEARRLACGARARQWIETGYSLDGVGARFVALYRDLLEEQRYDRLAGHRR